MRETASQLAQDVNSGKLKPREVVDHYIARSEGHAKALNCYLHFDPAQAQAQADRVAKRVQNRDLMPLAGVPVVVKDNIATKGEPTTAGSRILAGFRPPYDAHVIERLRDAGAIILAKANCDEFAMGSSNENSAYGPVKNPWDLARVPGGSSGGSAAAVAADLAPLALGSDTGGSIRQPASFCGIVGLKPTYGLVSRYGLIAYGSSLDQIGPFARSVDDAALLLKVIQGKDARDSTSVEAPRDGASSGALRVGIVRDFFGDGIDADVKHTLETAIAVLKAQGAAVGETTLPHLAYSIPSYYVIATAEASANLARFDGIRYGYRSPESALSLKDVYRKSRSAGFGREVKQRIMLGTFTLSSGYYDAFYAKANRARELIAQDFAKAFKQFDVLVSPVAPTTAYKLGEKSQDPLAMYLGDICTIGINLAGLPAVSVPCGFDAKGLPVGMQLIGAKFSEEKLLRAAKLYESATDWHRRRPLGY